LFGVAGGALEYGFNGSSVGLSGVVYGLAAMLWVLGRRRPSGDPSQSRKWTNLIDARTTKFFVAWFFFCVVATWLDAMNIANFAHAGGALLGGLVGWAMVERGPKRGLAIALTIAALGACLASATVLRPWLNLAVLLGP
jgi:membrane associated rhomboid family serine protease